MRRPGLVLAALAVAMCTLGACSSGGSDPAARRPPSSPTSARASNTVQPTPATPSPQLRPGRSLPLALRIGNARQAITVVATSHASTTADLQAWTKVSGGWRPEGPSVTAHVGSGGIGTAREGSTRTPAGSFTLTQAFGHDADPGTRLPYVRTTPADWWISQPSSPLYNTRQRCASACSFTRGDPNEHLYYETPYYDYAVVIDYNTANAPGGVRPGAGSAFFLHVTDGRSTAGCVSIPKARLMSILRWLRPGQHPRILIGVR